MLKKKIIKILTKEGNSVNGEKIFLKLIKQLNKNFKEKSYFICQLSFSYLLPLFKIITIKNKKRRKKTFKEVPQVLKNFNTRTSMAIKQLIKNILKVKKKTAKNLYEELCLTLQKRSDSFDLKINNQKDAIKKKYLLNYFK